MLASASSPIFLKDLKVKNIFDIEPTQTLIVLNDTDTIGSAYDIMTKNKIHAAPVVRSIANDRTYVGIVDVYDLLRKIALDKSFSVVGNGNTEGQEGILKHTVGKILYEQKFTNLWTFLPDESLLRLIEAFGGGVHYGILFPTSPGTERMISQTDLVHFLYRNEPKWPELVRELNAFDIMQKKKERLPVSYGSPVTVHSSTHTVTALKKMYAHNVYAVAILDDNDRIIGNFSAFDLTGLAREHISILQKPVIEFLEIVHGGSVPDVVFCQYDTSLFEIMLKLIRHHIKRVWVQDGDGKVEGVVTMSDIIAMFQ